MKCSGQMLSRNAVTCRARIFSYGVHMDKTKSPSKTAETIGKKLSFYSHFLTVTDILAKFSPFHLLKLHVSLYDCLGYIYFKGNTTLLLLDFSSVPQKKTPFLQQSFHGM